MKLDSLTKLLVERDMNSRESAQKKWATESRDTGEGKTSRAH
jgi:hypothetical protein